ncbi:MAG: sulfurtransferase TusA family protein [Sulfuricaulis sp.]|uniref:sulfurtransferase TusA family protein n=1 Tax=Sulfuricaulis sp. TaxID=2003553 RepID=UPI0025ECD334|nr:sulfurtransferase TusA family protein [Sulfuricaulis sp.]MCR4345886.1 sulfurtransferase TusA family protein [Sulfuricaulis sp.]
MADHDLDLRGLNCPIPVMRMKKKMETMASGQTLRVLTTDPGSLPDFKAYAKKTGNTMLESKENAEGNFEFLLKRA